MQSFIQRHTAFLFFAWAVFLTESVAMEASPVERPNILWISTEDICPDLGCYGDPQARTPNLDRLAAEGVRFSRCFSISGVCAPSRSAIITGMYPTSIGTHHMRSQGVPPAYVKCFPEYLRAAGYYCTNNSKTDYNFDAPLTAWDECSATAHWRNRPKGRPFFHVINFMTTHESKVRCDDEQFARLTEKLQPKDRHAPAAAQLPPYYPDTPVTRRDWVRYYDLITAMDLQVAEILRQLEEDGLANDTIVFFFGDNGRGLPRAKRWLYDSGVHVPLIIRWPGRFQPKTVNDELVSFVDFAPTVLSMAGVKVPAYMQGRPFAGEQKAPARQYVYGARDRMDETYDIIRCVRDKQYKYIRNFEPQKPYAQYIHYMEQMPTMREMRRLHAGGELTGPQTLFFAPTKPEEELYDTAADPHEINNLATRPEYQDVCKRMLAALMEWMNYTQDLGLIPEPELKERMRPGGQWSVTAAPKIAPDGGEFQEAINVEITCPTEGASIAYTTETGKDVHWQLYSEPLRVSESVTLRVRACRLGYKDSTETTATFRIGSKSK